LEETFSRIAGRRFRIDFVTLPDSPSGDTSDGRTAARPPTSRRQKQQELMRHPLIRKASELFDTEVIATLEALSSESADDTSA
jgi:hypothetical protein